MSDSLYTSSRGLYPHQVRGISKWILRRSMLCTWSMGTGKSHLALAGGAMLFEEGMIDLLVVVCEQNKVPEWVPDFEEFTKLRVAKYMGAPKRREKIRESLSGPEPPQVLITTYETSRNDIGRFVKEGRRKVFTEGPLTEVLREVAPRGLAIVYDESARLGNRYQAAHSRNGQWVPQRGSAVYRAHEHALKEVRKVSDKVWVAGMSGTPIERNPEGIFNQVRLIDPALAGSIKKFQDDHVRYTDPFGRSSFKNITPDDTFEDWVTPLSVKLAPVIDHKDKTDPDIRDAFPEHTEEPSYVTLTKDHLALYRAVEDLRYDDEVYPDGFSDVDSQVMFGVLRQVAAHPAALVHSPAAAEPGTLAHTIVNRVGADVLSEMKSAKTDALVAKLATLVKGEGASAVVFTFFGQSVLPLLAERLQAEGFTVGTYHGGMSSSAKDAAMRSFRAGDFEVLLASNAGARGLNIPEAQYVIHYELCTTHAGSVQRINRISRIGSGHAQITSFSMVALDTIEEQILGLNFRRQRWHEGILPDGEDDGEGTDLKVDDRMALFRQERAKSVA